MGLRVLVGLACGLMVWPECVKLPPRDFGRLEVRVVDPAGGVVKGAKVLLAAGGRDLSRLPYGRHTVKVEAQGFSSGTRQVWIQKAHTVVRVRLEVGIECGPLHYALSGRIRGARKGEEIWVKAVPVAGASVEESLMERDGSFSIPGLTAQAHVLLVMRGDEVVYQRTVSGREAEPLEILLTGNKE